MKEYQCVQVAHHKKIAKVIQGVYDAGVASPYLSSYGLGVNYYALPAVRKGIAESLQVYK